MSEDTAWVEVAPRGLTRDGNRYREGRIVEVPRSALPNIVDVDPPRGREVSREYARAVRNNEPTDGIDPDPGNEEPRYQPEVDATPAAREIAETYEIDMTQIEGSGEGGRVLKRDVVEVLEARAG